MASSTKWRLNISSNNGSTYLGATAVTMSTSAGGSDACAGGTASASSTYSSSYSAAKAFDNNSATYWSTANTVTSGWIQYEFSGSVEIVQYGVQAPPSGYTTMAPQAWTLEYWDGAAWQTADTQTGQTGWLATEIRTFPVTSKMRWRINGTANRGANSYLMMATVELRSSVSGSNQATAAARCSSDSVSTGYPASAAIDGDNATSWSSGSGSFPHYWTYWFASATDIVEYVIRAAATSGGIHYEDYAPKTWELQYWTGSAWQAVDTRTDQPAWSSNEARTFTVPSSYVFPALTVAP